MIIVFVFVCSSTTTLSEWRGHLETLCFSYADLVCPSTVFFLAIEVNLISTRLEKQ